jgi:hypothetical protein
MWQTAEKLGDIVELNFKYDYEQGAKNIVKEIKEKKTIPN